MPLQVLIAVLLAALTHATWNLTAKRAAASRHFVWLYSLASTLLWAPAAVWALWQAGLRLSGLQCLALSATVLLHLGYSLALQTGYRAADLSLVYPVARGFGPLLSFLGAALLLHERPGPLAFLGLGLIVLGIALVANLTRSLRHATHRGVGWGLVTGTFIAAYTLNDGWAVKVLLVSPLIVDFAGNLFRVLALSPRAFTDWARLAREARAYARPALIVGLLGPLGYILVLYAMRIAPVSHVAPARELATLVGTFFGARLLREAAVRARLTGALCIVAGVVSLAVEQ
jgi:drug/metabolite transporter (DMT)-like permease